MTSQSRSVAFVGNSITQESIDPTIIGHDLDAAVDVFAADSSHLNTWTWIVRSAFWNRGKHPDVLVVTFHATSLEDDSKLEIGRLAQFFTTWTDWSELFETLPSLDDRVEFAVSSRWATFAVRDRIKERVLDIVPGYKPWVRFEKKVPTKTSTKLRAQAPTYRVLTHFLELAKDNNTRVIFVAFPTKSPDGSPAYDIPTEADAEIRGAGMTLLDLRRMPGLDVDKDYADDIHLNEHGREIYSRLLSSELHRLGV
ncbi:MAG TPA: hypothetical protein VGM39_08190 [Kofleriaceae bacterium]